MKDLTLKDLKPLFPGDKLLNEMLEDHVYGEVLEQELLDVLPDTFNEDRN